MLAFDVEIDGKHIVTAGADDWSVLGLHVSARRGIPDAPAESARVDDRDFSVGGLSQPDDEGISYHFRWGRLPLSIGSRVVVTLVDTDSPDPPVKRYRSDREVQEDPFTAEEIRGMRLQTYLELKREFGDASEG